VCIFRRSFPPNYGKPATGCQATGERGAPGRPIGNEQLMMGNLSNEIHANDCKAAFIMKNPVEFFSIEVSISIGGHRTAG
jgi:hypothetical protein